MTAESDQKNESDRTPTRLTAGTPAFKEKSRKIFILGRYINIKYVL